MANKDRKKQKKMETNSIDGRNQELLGFIFQGLAIRKYEKLIKEERYKMKM